MLSLLGLKDDYVSDGRVVTEFLKDDVGPKHQSQLEDLGAVYKQINASFGGFSLDTLCASTKAVASDSTNDATYAAGTIRLALWNAEFSGTKIDQRDVHAWIETGKSYLDQAAALCG